MSKAKQKYVGNNQRLSIGNSIFSCPKQISQGRLHDRAFPEKTKKAPTARPSREPEGVPNQKGPRKKTATKTTAAADPIQGKEERQHRGEDGGQDKRAKKAWHSDAELAPAHLPA